MRSICFFQRKHYELFSDHLSPSLSLRAFSYSPLVMKVRSRASSIMSGASTPGGGKSNSLSENDLRRADAALSHVHDGQVDGVNGVNGKH